MYAMRGRYQKVNYIPLSCLLRAYQLLILVCDVCVKIRTFVNEVVLG